MFVPSSVSMSQGWLVQGRHFNAPWGHTHVELETFPYPAGMNTLDIRIINDWGDDIRHFYNTRPNTTVRHAMRWPTEPYGARLSTVSRPPSGGANGFTVPVRFFSSGIPTHHINFNAMGGRQCKPTDNACKRW